MSRSIPKVRPGLKGLAEDTVQSNILAFLNEQMLKGDDEPITITELAELLPEKRSRVMEALQRLTDRGLLTAPSGQDWGMVGGFTIRKPTYNLAQASTNRKAEDSGQEEMDYSREQDPDRAPLPAPHLTREQRRKATMRDDVEVDGTNFIGVVSGIPRPEGGDGYVGYELDVWVKDVGSKEPAVHRVREQRGDDGNSAFSSPTEAWRWFDQFVMTQAPDGAADALGDPWSVEERDFLDCLALCENAEGDVYLAKDAHDRLRGIADRDIEEYAADSEFTVEPEEDLAAGAAPAIHYDGRAFLLADEGGYSIADVLALGETPEGFDYITHCNLLPATDGPTPLCPELFSRFVEQKFEGQDEDDFERENAIASGRVAHLGRIYASDPNGAAMPEEEEEGPNESEDTSQSVDLTVVEGGPAQEPATEDESQGGDGE